MNKLGISAVAIAMIIIFSIFYYGFNKIDQLVSDNARLESQLVQVTDANRGLSRDLNRFIKETEANAAELRRVQQEIVTIEGLRRERESELRAAIGRQDTVYQRPTLVERMARRNWQDFVDGISCDTGATERCRD